MADEQEKLFNKNYIFCCLSNFLLNFSFFIVIPILALYLKETYESNGAEVGFVLSIYVIAAMVIRPFSAYIIDSFPRKPFFVGALAIFATIFMSYNFASTIGMFVVLSSSWIIIRCDDDRIQHHRHRCGAIQIPRRRVGIFRFVKQFCHGTRSDRRCLTT